MAKKFTKFYARNVSIRGEFEQSGNFLKEEKDKTIKDKKRLVASIVFFATALFILIYFRPLPATEDLNKEDLNKFIWVSSFHIFGFAFAAFSASINMTKKELEKEKNILIFIIDYILLMSTALASACIVFIVFSILINLSDFIFKLLTPFLSFYLMSHIDFLRSNLLKIGGWFSKN